MSLAQDINNAFDKDKQVLLVIDKTNYNEIKTQLEPLGYKCFDQLFIDHFTTNKPLELKDYPLDQWRKYWRDTKDYIVQKISNEKAIFFSCFDIPEDKSKKPTKFKKSQMKGNTCHWGVLNSIASDLEDLPTKIIVVVDNPVILDLFDVYLTHHDFSWEWDVIRTSS